MAHPMTTSTEPTQVQYRKTALITATQWFKDGDHPAVVRKADVGIPWIETLEGGHVVTPGDWIATGVNGEHWAIKPDIFATTYEPEPIPSTTLHRYRTDTEPTQGELIDALEPFAKLADYIEAEQPARSNAYDEVQIEGWPYTLGVGELYKARAVRDVLRAASAQPRGDAEQAVDPELIERVRFAVEHPDAQGFLLAKASMTRHDFRRILAALAQSPQAGGEGWRGGDKAIYRCEEADLTLAVTIVQEVEGWWLVRHSDESRCIVRPSRLHPPAQPYLPSEGETAREIVGADIDPPADGPHEQRLIDQRKPK